MQVGVDGIESFALDQFVEHVEIGTVAREQRIGQDIRDMMATTASEVSARHQAQQARQA
jgi:hypothetical protein